MKLRSVDTSRMESELEDIMDIYNDAWEGKWGMVPALPDEVEKIAKDMKLIIDPDIAFMAEINGKSAGMCIMLPNMNEAIADLGGKLFPFGFAKLLWRVKVKHPESARLMMLGIKGEARTNVKRYGGLSRGDVRRGRQARLRQGLQVGRALVDTRGRRANQPRHPLDGREGLQEVPRVPKSPGVRVKALAQAKETCDDRATYVCCEPAAERHSPSRGVR